MMCGVWLLCMNLQSWLCTVLLLRKRMVAAAQSNHVILVVYTLIHSAGEMRLKDVGEIYTRAEIYTRPGVR